MKNKLAPILLLMPLVLSGCIKRNNSNNTNDNGSKISNNDSNFIDPNDVEEIEIDSKNTEFSIESNENNTIIQKDNDSNTFTTAISSKKGNVYSYSLNNNQIVFTIESDCELTLSGEFYGSIKVNDASEYKLVLNLSNFKINSFNDVPLYVGELDGFELSAKSETVNYIIDQREEVDDEGISGCVYTCCDTDLKGRGELYVKSVNNNGIHCKDDLTVKNLTLQVECNDNALKGNDSLTVESGNLTLISCKGDCLKTSNSDISEKLKQRGTITIMGGSLLLYSATDGIDASYDVVINSDTSVPNIQIFTDKYSSYSKEVTSTSSSMYYLRTTNKNYNYSVYYYNSSSDYVWKNATYYTSVNNGRSTYYYYKVDKPSNYNSMQVYQYTSSQSLSQNNDYYLKSSLITTNDYYDTIALANNYGSLKASWTNYTTSYNNPFGPGGGMGPGGGGMNEGNNDKGDYSTKGIKADNSITISSGIITINSYDDAIHANNDETLENSQTPTGNITINEGIINVNSNDDGIHADGLLTINGGTIRVNKSYEGIEGNKIIINGGDIGVVSSDDGMNATATSGNGIEFNGGNVYVYASGDGIDANSKTSYSGFIFNGSNVIIIQTSGGNSAIDTENGYKYNSGYVLAIGLSSGMVSETRNCSNFSSVGKYQSLSFSKNNYCVVDNIVVVKLPVAMSATVVFLGSNSVSLSKNTTCSLELNDLGVAYY